jgi:ADP-ribose pyrophosphatase YjhB (NUDIX family)
MPPRVVAYVVERAGDGFALLVFDQEGNPEAGTRVPAGGIPAAESRRQAALRHVREQTGVDAARIVTEAGIIESPHPETGQPRRTSYWVLEVAAELSSAWRHVVTAHDERDEMVFLRRWERMPLEVALADQLGSLLTQVPVLLA